MKYWRMSVLGMGVYIVQYTTGKYEIYKLRTYFGWSTDATDDRAFDELSTVR